MNPSECEFFAVVMHRPDATETARIQVIDGDADWIFQFGIEGDQVGLFSVTVPKFAVANHNFLGALNYALSKLSPKQRIAEYAGKAMGQ
jgi:hypothetical protein